MVTFPKLMSYCSKLSWGRTTGTTGAVRHGMVWQWKCRKGHTNCSWHPAVPLLCGIITMGQWAMLGLAALPGLFLPQSTSSGYSGVSVVVLDSLMPWCSVWDIAWASMAWYGALWQSVWTPLTFAQLLGKHRAVQVSNYVSWGNHRDVEIQGLSRDIFGKEKLFPTLSWEIKICPTAESLDMTVNNAWAQESLSTPTSPSLEP